MEHFSYEKFEDVFDKIIDQKYPKEQIKNILLEINDIGYSKDSFLGAALALKKRMRKISAPKNTIDVCGTGGDKLNTLNISTAVCFVVAAAGVPVAKHGNKAISSQSGSADIFQALNIKISDDINEIEKNLREKNLSFLFAPFFHTSLKSLAEIRKEISLEFNQLTIFNYLGPLLNPTDTKTQLIGTSKKSTMLPMLETLKEMGSQKVYIVHGFDGMDEITLCDNSYLMSLEDGKILEEKIINPENFGFKKTSLLQLKGGDANYNAKKLIALFDGEKSAYLDIVILNSAFALELAGKAHSIEEGIFLAQNLIDTKKVKAQLLKLTN